MSRRFENCLLCGKISCHSRDRDTVFSHTCVALPSHDFEDLIWGFFNSGNMIVLFWICRHNCLTITLYYNTITVHLLAKYCFRLQITTCVFLFAFGIFFFFLFLQHIFITFYVYCLNLFLNLCFITVVNNSSAMLTILPWVFVLFY